MRLLLGVVLLVGVGLVGGAVNVTDGEERYPAWDIYTPDPTIDHKWEGSVRVWYIPMWNKVEMDKFREEVNGSGEACAYSLYNGTDYDEWHGYGDKVIKVRGYDHHLRPLQVEYTILNPDGSESGFVYESRTVLTDNKSFTLEVVLWKDNRLGFKVFSTLPKLQAALEDTIKAKVLSLGFKEHNILFYDYQKNCPGLKDQLDKWTNG